METPNRLCLASSGSKASLRTLRSVSCGTGCSMRHRGLSACGMLDPRAITRDAQEERHAAIHLIQGLLLGYSLQLGQKALNLLPVVARQVLSGKGGRRRVG